MLWLGIGAMAAATAGMAGETASRVAFWAGVMLTYVALLTDARAHDAPKGWRYDYACCSSIDCRPVPPAFVEETPKGFRMVVTGEEIPANDRRIRVSPDGDYHWCTPAGKDAGRTICLYVPPRSF